MSDSILVPYLELKIGKKQVPALVRDLIDVTVRESLGMASEFTLTVHTWDPDRLELSWVDSPVLAIGKEVEIKLGYMQSMTSLIIGEILSLNLHFSSEAPFTLSIKGQDLRHKMARTPKAVIRKQVSDYEVAKEIAGQYGLGFKGEDTKFKHEYLPQPNLTDLAFLNHRAAESGCELMMEGKTLLYKPLKPGASPVLTLSPSRGLTWFEGGVTSTGRAGKVVVLSQESGQGETLIGEAPIPDDLAGLLSADKTFSDVVYTVLEPSLETQEEADKKARAVAGELQAGYLTASGTCFGNTKVRPGALIKIDGMGKRFSQNYVVTSATHSFSVSTGYSTAFELRGNL